MRPDADKSGGKWSASDLIYKALPYARLIPVAEYDLDATLDCGQAFRWERLQNDGDNAWCGVIGNRQVVARKLESGLQIHTASNPASWDWAEDYFSVQSPMPAILQSFPGDKAMRAALDFCPGLRVLNQDPWETLATFILSSNKQIVQIRQMVALLSQSLGQPIEGPGDARAFPRPEVLAASSEADLRQVKLGYRAPYLLETSRMIAEGKLDLDTVKTVDLESARAMLMTCPGVGRKIADCALLFGFGFTRAFPVDVWVDRILRGIYFSGRCTPLVRLRAFTDNYFGPYGGIAQQYLFHWVRVGRPDLAAYRVPFRERSPSRTRL